MSSLIGRGCESRDPEGLRVSTILLILRACGSRDPEGLRVPQFGRRARAPDPQGLRTSGSGGAASPPIRRACECPDPGPPYTTYCIRYAVYQFVLVNIYACII